MSAQAETAQAAAVQGEGQVGGGFTMADLYPASRLQSAAAAAARAGLDALLLTPGPDLRYLTGYDTHQTERLTCLAVPAPGPPFLVLPRLELASAQASPAGGMNLEFVVWDETDDPYRAVAQRLGGVDTVGLAGQMWAMMVLRFRDAMPGARQTPAASALRALRIRKTPAEVAALAEAGAAIDRVHASVPQWLRPGRTERAAAADIASAIAAQGHARIDFVIVGSGPNAAKPHHEPADRVLSAGDAVARDMIAAAGYGEHFTHRTGHGIGLETHEDPYIVAGNTEELQEGMAFSVEPGVYPGPHGARIEDIVVCTADGYRRLNKASRDLIVVA